MHSGRSGNRFTQVNRGTGKFAQANSWGDVTRGRRAYADIAPAEAGAAHSSRYTASDPSFSQTSTFDTRTRSPSLSASFRFASS